MKKSSTHQPTKRKKKKCSTVHFQNLAPETPPNVTVAVPFTCHCRGGAARHGKCDSLWRCVQMQRQTFTGCHLF